MSLNVDDSVVKRINELRSKQGNKSLTLRVRVEGGGCSGFQYKMELSEDKKQQDIVFKDVVVTDAISMNFLDGATISFEKGLIGTGFKIENPNAVAGCGCGASFSVI